MGGCLGRVGGQGAGCGGGDEVETGIAGGWGGVAAWGWGGGG